MSTSENKNVPTFDNCTIKQANIQARGMNIPPKTMCLINSKERYWYTNRFLSKATFEYHLRRSTLIASDKMMVKCGKDADKRNGLGPYEDWITVEHIQKMRKQQNDRCNWCFVLMDSDSRPRTLPHSMTLERYDATIGHTIGNCCLACRDCNCHANVARVLKKASTNVDMIDNLIQELRLRRNLLVPDPPLERGFYGAPEEEKDED